MCHAFGGTGGDMIVIAELPSGAPLASWEIKGNP